MFWSHNHEQNYLQQHQACNSEWCIESNIYPVFFTRNFNNKDSLSIVTFFLFCEIFVIQYQIGFLTMFLGLICILMLSKSNWNGWMLTAIAETYRFPSWNLKVTTIKSSAVVGFGFKKSWNKSSDIVIIKSPCSADQDIGNYCSMLITKSIRLLTLKVKCCFNDIPCHSKCLGSWYFMCVLCERY